ncbi:MAG: hypothetical protein ACKOBW_10200 [Planctomycetota bacterium]
MKRPSKLIALLQDESLPTSELEKITTEMLQSMRADRQFVRKVRERAFLAIQRCCERPLWEKLLTLAAKQLNQAAAKQALQAGEAVPRPRTFHDWTQHQLRSVMARIDESLISNAISIVTLDATDKVASLSLPTLLAILIDAGGNWPDLGSLPSYAQLRSVAYCAAIGVAQVRFCEFHGRACPKEELPTDEELVQLDRWFRQDSTTRGSEHEVASSQHTLRRWGAGWLLARSILGMNQRGVDQRGVDQR